MQLKNQKLRNKPKRNNRLDRASPDSYKRMQYRVEKRESYIREWQQIVIHFFGTYIKEGVQLQTLYAYTLKDFESLMSIHTQMIQNDTERKEKELKEKQEREATRLLMALKSLT